MTRDVQMLDKTLPGGEPRVLRYRSESEYFTEELCHITELSNGPHDEGLSIALVRVEPGVTTRWHRLVGTSERYVIVAGEGVVEVDDLPAQAVGQHDVVFIPAGTRQRITNTGSTDLCFYAVCVPRFRASVYEDLEGSE